MKDKEFIKAVEEGEIYAELDGEEVRVTDAEGNIWDEFLESDILELCQDYVIKRAERQGNINPLDEE